MRMLTPEEIAEAAKEADEAIANDDYSTYGDPGAFVVANLVAHIRLIEHELECYRTKYDPPFELSPPTLPKRMEKVIRRPARSAIVK